MAVTKRTRYEILRRDNHACRYCGATAPDAKLTVDHVLPTALGGSDAPENLVTACADCNMGKASTIPGAPLVADVTADAFRWATALQASVDDALADHYALLEYRQSFKDAWNAWTYPASNEPDAERLTVPMAADWRQGINTFYARQVPIDLLCEAVRIAMNRPKVALDEVYRYFCGVAWRQLDDITEQARQRFLAAGEEST